jgi:hypothetical protein
VALGPEGVNLRVRQSLRELLELRADLAAAGLIPAGSEIHEAARLLRENPELPEDRAAMAQRFLELVEDPIFGVDGPFWYRGNAQCPPLLETPRLTGVLEAWGAERVVMGHTPTPDRRVRTRLGGMAVLADTGMLAAHYGGRPAAVIIEPGRMTVRYANGARQPTVPVADDGTPLSPLDESSVQRSLAMLPDSPEEDAGWQAITLDGSELSIRALERGRRARNLELAALRLDRLLGLNVVLPVAESETARRRLLAAAWPDVLNETQRRETGIGGVPRCGDGSALDLIYAFDALIGNAGRSADNILYDPHTWRVGSIGHADSFGRSDAFPTYIEQTPQWLPPALAERLRALTRHELDQALDDLLSSSQIRAVLARRDRLLDEWRTAD